MTQFAEVAVNSPAAPRRTFSYEIPPQIELRPGHAVWVPFGTRLLQGIVFELTPYPEVDRTRAIAQVIDPRPLLSPHQLHLARWISSYYLCPLFQAAALMLPPGFERRLLTFFSPLPQPPPTASLSQRQREVLAFLERRGRVELRQVRKGPRSRETEAILGQLVRRGLALRTQELEPAKVRHRLVPHLRAAIPPAQVAQEVARLWRARDPQQAHLLELLTQSPGPVPLSQVRRWEGYSPAALAALVRQGLASLERLPVPRDPLAGLAVAPSPPPPLTPDQERAWEPLKGCLLKQAAGQGRGPAFLLHGVTGSGKTEVYLRALALAVEQGRRGIVLVPEIALTPQTINRFAARFPGQVAVLHSRLSLGEQFDEWQRIREGHFQVVIGSRSALFAPQPDLALIVVDEEHEWAYKQEQPPRYHAREVALKLAELCGALVILGSATPDVETYHRSEQGQLARLELPRRVGSGQGLPQVEVVDLRQELKAGNRSIFSRALEREMARALEAGEQVILFLNRRGSASFVQCRDCGHVLGCRRCAVSLTYHGASEALVCHQCHYQTPPPQLCPQCASPRIKFLGLGTERVEAEARRAFPQARLLRWDRDVVRGKGAHERILSQFLAHEADILIGTQMVAKGLHLPAVTLVGVISADVALHLPHFRAGERTFQLLTQVAGRAGRGQAGGRVIIQTYTPDHYAVAAACQDYPHFYRHEIELRRQLGYPPFSRLVRLLYSDTNPQRCQREAERVCRMLREEVEARGLSEPHLLGPTPAYLQRLRGRYRWQALLLGREPHLLLEELTLPQGWAVDVDPVDLL